MYTLDNREIKTLADLNAELGQLPNRQDGGYTVPLAVESFDQTLGPAEWEIDGVIANSNEQVYDWIEVAELVASLNRDMQTALADPQGYVAKEHAQYWAYIHDGGFGLSDQAYNLLVDAANKLGEARHKTGDARNAPADANGYVHLYSDNAIYAFQDTGDHRGYPMVKVIAQGSVSDGQHNF